MGRLEKYRALLTILSVLFCPTKTKASPALSNARNEGGLDTLRSLRNDAEKNWIEDSFQKNLTSCCNETTNLRHCTLFRFRDWETNLVKDVEIKWYSSSDDLSKFDNQVVIIAVLVCLFGLSVITLTIALGIMKVDNHQNRFVYFRPYRQPVVQRSSSV